MTSSIGSSNLTRPASLEPLANNRSSKPSGLQQPAGNTSGKSESVLPTPVGPLGHTINTTA
ncbi:hypothetical protein [Paraburkholderia bannensis]|uniref:hypothetical protein n=1 Tax=Paraburkholderia bannensis TaxID=765414 RepID=UPI0004847D34|nr:hypothetical protein [Paraburkholderia bannensis]